MIKPNRFIYNNDGSFILFNSLHGGRPLTIEDVRDYVDLTADSQITTFMVCTCASMPYYPSQVERSIGSAPPEEADILNNANDKYKRFKHFDQSINSLAEQNTDIITICVERARENGMEAFATMRMNDVHAHDTTVYNPLSQGDFWLNHPEYRVGDHPGWHADGALNFAHEAVRKYKLDLIKEICERFDIDGLELDFMRMPVYFPYNQGEANITTMTDFVRQARAIVEATGKRRGKAMQLSVRVPPTLARAQWIGLDPGEWARQGLVDFITSSNYYIDEPALPIAQFRRELACDAIPVYANIDRRVLRPGCNEMRSHDLFRGAAALLHKNGADGIYLFNHFFAPSNPAENMKKPEGPDPNGIWEFPAGIGPSQKLLNELGTLESLCRRNKRYALGTSNEEYGFNNPRDLPCPLKKDNPLVFSHDIADDIDAHPPAWAAMIVRTKAIATAPFLKFNGVPLKKMPVDEVTTTFPGSYPMEEGESLFAYSVPTSILCWGDNKFSLSADTEGDLLQADLCLAYTQKRP